MVFRRARSVYLALYRLLTAADPTPLRHPAYTAEVSADVSVVLTNYRDTLTDRKVHEIALVVAHGWGKRLGEKAADRLFLALKRGIEDAPELDVLEEWKRPDGKPLLPRRAVWRHFNDEAGRKLLRPVVERAAKEWSG